MSRVPASFRLEPIDDAARNGCFQIVFGHPPARQEEFALVRWQDDAWRFVTGRPLPFQPESYLPRRRQQTLQEDL